MNQLSMKAYHKENESGRLSGRRQMVYDIIRRYENGCTTSCVLNEARYSHPKIEKNAISGRITELVERDMVMCYESVKDDNTGHSVSVWGITGRTTPLELPKKPNKDRIIQQLREENAKLKKENATLNDTICGIARSVYE